MGRLGVAGVFGWACAAVFLGLSAHPASQAPSTRTWDERRIPIPPAGTAIAYVPQAPTTHVVVLISGAAGWDSNAVDLARKIAAEQAVVIGVSYPALKKSVSRDRGCWYVASDFELISHEAQKALNLPQYHAPVLVGVGAGAPVVYAALANTPATTFAGGVSVGFCPRIPAPTEICSGDAWSPEYDDRGHVNTLPTTKEMPKDWYVLAGTGDRICPIAATRTFVAGVPKAHLVELPGTAGVKLAPEWQTALDSAFRDLWTEKEVKPAAAQPKTATTRELEDELNRLQLPLEFRWPSQLSSVLVFFSGDGGWASLDEETAEQLITHGVGVVGVSSLRYFWNAKTPAQVAGDIRRLVTILGRGGRPIFVGGFSFGAEIVPVALTTWPAADRHLIAGLTLIAPGPSASFEIDPLDWIRKPADNPSTGVGPAVRQLAMPTLCLAGADEDDTPCASLGGATGVRVVRLPGSHHFNSDYAAVAEAVWQFIRPPAGDRRP